MKKTAMLMFALMTLTTSAYAVSPVRYADDGQRCMQKALSYVKNDGAKVVTASESVSYNIYDDAGYVNYLIPVQRDGEEKIASVFVDLNCASKGIMYINLR